MRRLFGLFALASTLLTGCIDCFDGAELEAAHREGEATAADINAGEYQRGRLDAAQLTYEDGLADGDADGYTAGYNDGFYGLLGYASGYELGYLDGHDDGGFDPTACDAGANNGYLAGGYDGFDLGWSEGYATAYDDGYGIGIVDGESSCSFVAVELERDEPQICASVATTARSTLVPSIAAMPTAGATTSIIKPATVSASTPPMHSVMRMARPPAGTPVIWMGTTADTSMDTMPLITIATIRRIPTDSTMDTPPVGTSRSGPDSMPAMRRASTMAAWNVDQPGSPQRPTFS